MVASTLKPKSVLTSTRAKELERSADALATKLATSEDLTKSFWHAINTEFASKLTTAEVHFSLFDMFDDAQEIADWPLVGSIEGYTDKRPFDLFKYKDSEGKEQPGSYWRMVATHHPVGIELHKMIQKIVDSDKDGVKNEFTKLSPGDRKREKEDWSGKFTTFFGKLKMGVQLYHKMEDARARLPTITVDYDRNPVVDEKTGKVVIEDGEPVTEINMKSPRIICVTDKVGKGNRFFTIPNFLRLDVDRALAAGGKYEDFITSNGREAEDESDEIVENPVKIVHPVDFENVTVQTLHYLNAIKNSVPAHKGLLAFYQAAGSDDRLQTLFNLYEVLSILTENPDLKKRAEALGIGTQTPEQAAAAVAKKGSLTSRKAA